MEKRKRREGEEKGEGEASAQEKIVLKGERKRVERKSGSRRGPE